MSEPLLTPGKAALLMVGLGTAALMGVPGVGTRTPPAGALTGAVVDAHGAPVEDCAVALFDGRDDALVEITHSDAEGRFGFQQHPARYHVFARPRPASGQVGTWVVDRVGGLHERIELQLPEPHALTVRVLDELGLPLPHAEVRLCDADRGGRVVTRVRTNADGHAELFAPENAHIGVFGADDACVPGWRFDVHVPSGGRYYEFLILRGRRYRGRAVDADGAPLSGIVASSWTERDQAWQWNGYGVSGEDGSFTLVAAGDRTAVLLRDPALGRLPARVDVGPERTELGDVVLRDGAPLAVRCRTRAGGPWPARVWLWSERERVWSWGGRTDAEGLRAAPAAARYGVLAEPLRAGGRPAALWDKSYGGPSVELVPGDPPR